MIKPLYNPFAHFLYARYEEYGKKAQAQATSSSGSTTRKPKEKQQTSGTNSSSGTGTGTNTSSNTSSTSGGKEGEGGENQEPAIAKGMSAEDIMKDAEVRRIQQATEHNNKMWSNMDQTEQNGGQFGDGPNKDYDIYEIKAFTPVNLNSKVYDNIYGQFGFYEDNIKGISSTNSLEFQLPNWGVEDYINERSMFLKGIHSVANEPGWFYFKPFFRFDTNFGLFGGVLQEHGRTIFSGNCALRFFAEAKSAYFAERIYDRALALQKFTRLLSKINRQYPWLIKKVNNLGSTFKRFTDQEDLEAERKIELVFSAEQTDMKLLNLLHLYRYICYDDINAKCILPENLRKFDMMFVFYHVPLKYFQTGIMTANVRHDTQTKENIYEKASKVINTSFSSLTGMSNYYAYKRMHPDNGDFSNMMSFHMVTLHNCEFDASAFDAYFSAAEMSNETAFQVSEVTIPIKYGRAYHHTMNEWEQYLFGSDGFYYNGGETITQKNLHFKRLNALIEAEKSSQFYDPTSEQYKSLIDYAESVVMDGLRSMSMKEYYMYTKGNIYGDFGDPNSMYNVYKRNWLKGANYLKGNLFGGNSRGKSGGVEKFIETKMHDLAKHGKLGGNIFSVASAMSLNSFYNINGARNSANKPLASAINQLAGLFSTIRNGKNGIGYYNNDSTKSKKFFNDSIGHKMTQPEPFWIKRDMYQPKFSDYVNPPNEVTNAPTPLRWLAKQSTVSNTFDDITANSSIFGI